MDDGSPDECPKICDDYAKKDNRIKVIHKKNGGLSSARNAGLDIINGDFIAFIDSDDLVSKYYVEDLYDAAIKYNADIAQCGFISFNDDEEDFLPQKKYDYNAYTYDNLAAIGLIYKKGSVVVWNKLYRRKIYENLRFPDGKINEDEFCTYKAFDSAELVVVIDSELYYYRCNDNSIMRRKYNTNRLAVIDAYDERINYFHEKGYDELYIKTILMFHSMIKNNYTLTLENIKDKELKTKTLHFLKMKFSENYNRMKNLKEISLKQKVSKWLYSNFPGIITSIKLIKKRLYKDIFNCITKHRYKIYSNKCKKNNQNELIIFNTPVHSNLGDHAIIQAELDILSKNGIYAFEVPTAKYSIMMDAIDDLISSNAIISITGGGFMGSQWLYEEKVVLDVLDKFQNHRVIVFPATVYFKNNDEGEFELNKLKNSVKRINECTFLCREEKTYEFVNNELNVSKSFLVPDIVLTLNKSLKKYKRKNQILLCFRKDAESSIKYDIKDYIMNYCKEIGDVIYSDTVIEKSVKIGKRKKALNKKLEEFSKSKIVITDRLHGMIFAAITGTPCIVFGNYNYKVKGVYDKWIKEHFDYVKYIDDLSSFEKDCTKLLHITAKSTEFDFSSYFDNIIKEIR